MNVWGHITHFAVDPPQSYIDKFADVHVKESDFSDYMQQKFEIVKKSGDSLDPHMQAYLADVFSLDEDVGRLLGKLDELGLRENTIVVFSSDQGAAPVQNPSERKAKRERSDLRLNMLGYNGGLRGGKHTMYEGGVRIPLIIRWPGHVPAGRIDEASVTSGIDWLPTLCAITGVKINAADFEGENVSSAWLGKTFARSRPLLWKTSTTRSEMAIRDGQWKLHDPNRNRGEVELFDVTSDPGERNNLAATRPDVVKVLRDKLAQWNSTLPTDYIKADDKDD
jgi:N-acetylgalactosamine-6-sulfatase